MRIFRDMTALPPLHRPVVTVGSFDGVHRGHLFLLDVLRARAAMHGGRSVVVTFDHHPRRVLGSGEGMIELTSSAEKAALLDAAGVDNLIVMPFTAGVAELSAEEFVRDFLVGRLGVHELVVGYNHRLGRDREGDAAILETLGEKYGFSVFKAPKFEGVPPKNINFSEDTPLKIGGASQKSEKISSTTIREAISRGDLATAERLLGRKIDTNS
jgi:FAD synthase